MSCDLVIPNLAQPARIGHDRGVTALPRLALWLAAHAGYLIGAWTGMAVLVGFGVGAMINRRNAQVPYDSGYDLEPCPDTAAELIESWAE